MLVIARAHFDKQQAQALGSIARASGHARHDFQLLRLADGVNCNPTRSGDEECAATLGDGKQQNDVGENCSSMITKKRLHFSLEMW